MSPEPGDLVRVTTESSSFYDGFYVVRRIINSFWITVTRLVPDHRRPREELYFMPEELSVVIKRWDVLHED